MRLSYNMLEPGPVPGLVGTSFESLKHIAS